MDFNEFYYILAFTYVSSQEEAPKHCVFGSFGRVDVLTRFMAYLRFNGLPSWFVPVSVNYRNS